jgi:hypothetical protein
VSRPTLWRVCSCATCIVHLYKHTAPKTKTQIHKSTCRGSHISEKHAKCFCEVTFFRLDILTSQQSCGRQRRRQCFARSCSHRQQVLYTAVEKRGSTSPLCAVLSIDLVEYRHTACILAVSASHTTVYSASLWDNAKRCSQS